jgi:hypothetical protein
VLASSKGTSMDAQNVANSHFNLLLCPTAAKPPVE